MFAAVHQVLAVRLRGLTADESAFFRDGLTRFAEIEVVTGGTNNGLGPRFNSNQCLSCHSQPAAGGSSPARNPLIAIATLTGARNLVPWFITQNGPVREARFKRNPTGTNDGEVHDLFVITGRSDAAGCNITQPNFLPAGNPLSGQGGNTNVIFRVPTPVFGAGLIEAIPDSAILANMEANTSAKSGLGISGHANAHLSGNANISANDGTITRFGWKAQNKSLLMFAAKHTTSRWGSRTNCFHKNVMKLPAVFSMPHQRIRSTLPRRLRPLPTPTLPSSQTSKRSLISCGCWPRPLLLLPRHPVRMGGLCSQESVVSTVTRLRLPRAG